MNKDSIPRGERFGAAAWCWKLVKKIIGLRTFALIVVLVSAAAFPVRAQEFPRWESFGGFSCANVGLGPQANLFGPVSKNYYGIHLGVNLNPYRKFSVVLTDLGMQSRGSRVPRLFRNSNNNVVTSQALFGPELKIRRRKENVFAHTLVGVTNTRLVETDSFGTIDLVRRTNLALGLGGGIEVNRTPRLAVRVLQADYVPTRLAGKWQNDFRVSIGVVFRFQYTGGR
jgi:Outer membrane protein beta-barrel domain